MTMKDFESSLKQLEEIVLQLEGGDLALDKALELFEQSAFLRGQLSHDGRIASLSLGTYTQ